MTTRLADKHVVGGSMASIMSVRQAAQLDMALERAGATAADVDKVCQGDTLVTILKFIRGHAVIIVKHIVDMATAPFCPTGWEVEEHIAGDSNFDFGEAKFTLLSQSPTKGTTIRESLRGGSILNANLLDHLLCHQGLIQGALGNCKHKRVFFWGTIYRDSRGTLYVRCLCWDGEEWDWEYESLENDFQMSDLILLARNR